MSAPRLSAWKDLVSEDRIGEVWKKIPGYEKYYISNHGRVRNQKSKRLLCQKFRSNRNGERLRVWLSRPDLKSAKPYQIHVLVMNAFKPRRHELEEVVDHIHIDRTEPYKRPTNNHIDNLRWLTIQLNCLNNHRAKGCTKQKNHYIAELKCKKKRIYWASFKTKDEAAAAYLHARNTWFNKLYIEMQRKINNDLKINE